MRIFILVHLPNFQLFLNLSKIICPGQLHFLHLLIVIGKLLVVEYNNESVILIGTLKV